MSMIFLAALLVGGVLLGVSFLLKNKTDFSSFARQIMAMSALLVPAIIVLSACTILE